MDLRVLCVLSVLCATAYTKNNERRAVGFLSLVSTSVDFANFIFEIVNGNDEKETASPENLENAKNEIITAFSEKLAVVQDQLYGGIKETMSLSKIDEVNYKIQSVLLDLRAYLLANESEKIIEKERFETQASLIIADIRSLPSRLETSLANADVSLLELMAANSKCNMSGIKEFKDLFFNLTQTGIIIELSYKKLKQNSLVTESEWWDRQVRQMIDSFEKEDSRGDMETLDNVKELSNTMHQKYVWYFIDVFILQQNNGGEEIYIEGNETNMMTMSVNGLRKYVIYVDKQTRRNDIKCILLKTNMQTPLNETFILDRGNFKKTTFLYDETDETRSCHPETVPVDTVKDQNNKDDESKKGLGAGEIVGIVLGSLVFLVVVVSWCCFIAR
ncbi:hypothetical protein MAR_001185 [Mya arenaria]|uniref:Uncharacterized protein n=1 Tax=Mya arenaria TaxID=6604 RepID=A0ABY7FEA7_MYAAR|nr:hypothetical protein MAR_001185 [Mya arenaria]